MNDLHGTDSLLLGQTEKLMRMLEEVSRLLNAYAKTILTSAFEQLWPYAVISHST